MHRDVASGNRTSRRWTAAAWLMLLCGLGATAIAQDGGLRRAADLMKNRQYIDAIKVLKADVQGKDDAALVKHHLMLGECHYLSKQFEDARGFFVRAARSAADDGDKAVAEYRMACVAFRLGDSAAAEDRISTFLARRSADPRCGILMTFKMQLVSAKGKDAQKELETLHERVVGEARKFGPSIVMEADEILCEFYRKTNQDDRALVQYQRLAANYRKQIADLEKAGQPVPPAFEKAHDNAALQLGAMHIDKKNYAEASKWLENVRYDAELKVRARLFLGKMAYEKGDWAQVNAYLTEKGFLAGLVDGATKWDVYLLLGLAERSKPGGDPGKAEEYLGKVSPQARGFAQAQAALGDVYRERGLGLLASKAYANAINSPDYGPHAMLWTGTIWVDQAAKETNPRDKAELQKKGVAMLSDLVQKHPVSAAAKQAKEKLTALAKEGVTVGPVAADDMLGGWEKLAREKAGTPEAAQALVQLIRVHARTLFDEKTRKMTRGPDYVAAAKAADRLIDARVYSTLALGDSGKGLRCEALYQRSLAELASISPSAELKAAGTTFVANPAASRAIEWLTEARGLVDGKQLDMVRGIELSLVEAMFKSDKEKDQEQARARLAQLDDDYGNDPRFSRLSLNLAEYYANRGMLADAAAQYANVARRGRDLGPDDAVKLWFTAGQLYSRAAYECQQKKEAREYAITLQLPEMIGTGGEVIRTDPRFSREVSITWPRGGQNITARDAVNTISRASGVPFVWPTAKGREAIATYLEDRKLTLKDGNYTVAQALAQLEVLDLKAHRVGYDIGLADGSPTIPQAKDETGNPAPIIEVYDARQEASRLMSLRKAYGNWLGVHKIGGRQQDQGVLLFDVLKHLQERTGSSVLWGDGIDREAKKGVELRERDVLTGTDGSCGAVLTRAAEKAGLTFRIVLRDKAARYYEDANRAFMESRKQDPRGVYAEKALFSIAVNYYNLRDYARMKEILKTYLKLFDDPSRESYQQACFWIGYALETEKKYREATNYYARAAEERLLITKAGDATTRPANLPAEDAIKAMLAYDSRFLLSEPLRGSLKEGSLDELATFLQFNAHVSVRIDPALAGETRKFPRENFRDVTGLRLLADALKEFGLVLRVENVNPGAAEKAYFRLADVHRRESLLDRALENCDLLLLRYPNTERMREVLRLKLDIYRGLRQYGKVFDMLKTLRLRTSDPQEQRELDVELSGIYFDLADYAKSAAAYKSAMDRTTDPRERLALRASYALALLRLNQRDEALKEYEELKKNESAPLARRVDEMMIFYLRLCKGELAETQFPEDLMQYILAWGELTEAQRKARPQEQAAMATWIYYTKALIAQEKKDQGQAIERLRGVENSPDRVLDGEARVRRGMLHLSRSELAEAQSAFEQQLFVGTSNEAAVRATYGLVLVANKQGDRLAAGRRLKEMTEKYPESPLTAEARKLVQP